MKYHISADSAQRIRISPDRLAELRAEIAARYAAKLAAANFWQRIALRLHMRWAERQARRKLYPSPYSLYGHHLKWMKSSPAVTSPALSKKADS